MVGARMVRRIVMASKEWEKFMRTRNRKGRIIVLAD
jgi:hypothetical protein